MAKRQTVQFRTVLITPNEQTASGRMYGVDSIKAMKDAISTGKIIVYSPDLSESNAPVFIPDSKKANGYALSAEIGAKGELIVTVAAYAKGILGSAVASGNDNRIVAYPVGTGSVDPNNLVKDYRLIWIGWNLAD